MSLYAIGDLHLSLSPEVDKPMEIYGPLWHDHVNRLHNYWIDMISHDDTVVLPGDISWGLKLNEALPDLEWVDKLPGKKVIFKGNHDLWWNGITKLNQMFNTITFIQNTSYYCEGVYLCGSRGWLTPDNDDFTNQDERVYKREVLRVKSSLDDAMRKMQEQPGEIIGVLHYPPVCQFASFSGFQQLFLDYDVKEVIYGHVHGEEGFMNTIKGNYHGTDYKLVSLDYLRCKPLKLR